MRGLVASATATVGTDAGRVATALSGAADTLRDQGLDATTALRTQTTTTLTSGHHHSLAPVAQGPVARIVSGLLAAIGITPGSAATTPVRPLAPQTLLGVLALIRREIEHTFFNTAPQFPTETISLVTDQGQPKGLTGLPATDSDGDAVSYTVPARGAAGGPANGTVAVTKNAAGVSTVTYTPDTDYDGLDTFTLTASDAGTGSHLHGLASLFNPRGAHTDTVTVTVTVTAAPVGNGAPVAQRPPTVGTPNGATGAVSGNLGVIDPDGDRLTYDLAPEQGPQNGIVTFDPETGTYTYTPTQAARLNAGLNSPQTFARSAFAAAAAAPTQDSFTVLVSDGELSTPVTVTVPISPARLTMDSTKLAVGPGAYNMALSPDGKFLYTANDGSVSVIDATTNTVVGAPIALPNPEGYPPITYDLVVSPDGQRLYVVDSAAPGITVIDTTTRTVVNRYPVESGLGGVAVSADGERLYIPSGDPSGGVLVLDSATGEKLTVIDAGGAGQVVIALSPDGARAYVTKGLSLVVIDTATDTVVQEIPFDTYDSSLYPIGLAVTPDGQRVYVNGLDPSDETYTLPGVVWAVDTATGTVIGDPITVGNTPRDIAISPDGSLVVVPNIYDGTISVIDTNTNTVIGQPIDIGAQPLGVAFSETGNHIYVTGFDANNGDAPGSVTIISVVPTQTAPPVISDPTPVGTPNPTTGAATFTVTVPAGSNGQPPTGFSVTQPAGVNGVITTGNTPVRNAATAPTPTPSPTPPTHRTASTHTARRVRTPSRSPSRLWAPMER